MAFWHDRYLTPFLARVNRVYNIGLCREKHTLIDVRSAATDDEDSDASGPVLVEGSS